MNKPTVTVYGIPNCSSVNKALAWLSEHGMAHGFHDFKKHGVPEVGLDRSLKAAGWELLLNRKGTTWRQLTPEQQASVVDAPSARALMLQQASVIKRPVLVAGSTVLVGVNPELWSRVFSAGR